MDTLSYFWHYDVKPCFSMVVKLITVIADVIRGGHSTASNGKTKSSVPYLPGVHTEQQGRRTYYKRFSQTIISYLITMYL